MIYKVSVVSPHAVWRYGQGGYCSRRLVAIRPMALILDDRMSQVATLCLRHGHCLNHSLPTNGRYCRKGPHRVSRRGLTRLFYDNLFCWIAKFHVYLGWLIQFVVIVDKRVGGR